MTWLEIYGLVVLPALFIALGFGGLWLSKH